MQIYHQHSWNISFNTAKNIQNKLRKNVLLKNTISLSQIQTIAAADISFTKNSSQLYAAVVLVSFPDLKLKSIFTSELSIKFPYVPGYLSFREVPVLLSIFKKMRENFDVLICDGQGMAHPRRFGLACHIGILLNKPTVGCAKSRLIGTFKEPSKNKGSISCLFDNDDKIGMVLRSRTNVKPLFISPGHLVNFEDCESIIMACVKKCRFPEPLRFAHQKVNEYRSLKLNG